MASNLEKILLVALSSLGASVILGTQLLKPVTAESPDGPFNVVQSGDVTSTSAVIWGRNDQPGLMLVELSTSEDFKDATTYQGSGVGPESDYTGKVWVRCWVSVNKLPKTQNFVPHDYDKCYIL